MNSYINVYKKPSKRITTCQICFNLITVGEYVVNGNLGSGNFAYNYHLVCWLNECGSFILDILDKLNIDVETINKIASKIDAIKVSNNL